jgi:hypothetical protein
MSTTRRTFRRVIVSRMRRVPHNRTSSAVRPRWYVAAPTPAPGRIGKSANKSPNQSGRIREYHQGRPEESQDPALHGRAEVAVIAEEQQEAK